ncbi:MAG: DNA polymerase IV, partial [Candidatus Omnitrophica bacterium]|nr:DNA polymerase IV [Candidatus Omnitrophota bacterium]
MKRIVGHLDMDAFFASLEERDNPQFKGLPIAVGSDPMKGHGRGVVSTANYKAREYGIHSALPITRAWKLSQEAKSRGLPEVIFLPPDFTRYNKSSENILKIIKRHCELVEQGSIDEFYFDLSFAKTYKKAEEVCKKIKEEIRKKEKVTCSCGIGPNKLIAKIATGMKKPDGLYSVEEKEAENFLAPMNIRKIPGIGPKTEQKLNSRGIKKVSDLKKFSKEFLKGLFGKWGEDIYYKIRAIDNSEIVEDREVKSIGEQATFLNDTLDPIYITEELEKMCKSVYLRFKKSGFKTFKTVAITVRFTGFITKTAAKTLKE